MEVEGSKDEGRTTAKQQQDEVLPDRHISRMQQNEQLLAVTSSQQPSRSFAEAQAVQTTSTAHGERIIQQQLQMPSNGSCKFRTADCIIFVKLYATGEFVIRTWVDHVENFYQNWHRFQHHTVDTTA